MFTRQAMLLLFPVLLPAVSHVCVASASALQHQSCGPGAPSGSGGALRAGPLPVLVFSHGNDIFRVDLEGTKYRRLVADAGTAVIMGFRYSEDRIYWVDLGSHVLQRVFLNGTGREDGYSLVSSQRWTSFKILPKNLHGFLARHKKSIEELGIARAPSHSPSWGQSVHGQQLHGQLPSELPEHVSGGRRWAAGSGRTASRLLVGDTGTAG